MLYGKSSKYLLEEENISPEDKELRRRPKYLKICKDAIRERWRNEKMQGLRECHNVIHKTKNNMNIKEGGVLMIKGDKKNHDTWTIRRVTKLFRRKGHLSRAVQLRAGKSHF